MSVTNYRRQFSMTGEIAKFTTGENIYFQSDRFLGACDVTISYESDTFCYVLLVPVFDNGCPSSSIANVI